MNDHRRLPQLWLYVVPTALIAFGMVEFLGFVASSLLRSIQLDFPIIHTITHVLALLAGFISGARMAPFWKVFSLVPQYLVLAGVMWFAFSGRTETYVQYLEHSAAMMMPPAIIAAIAIFFLDRGQSKMAP